MHGPTPVQVKSKVRIKVESKGSSDGRAHTLHRVASVRRCVDCLLTSSWGPL